MLSPDVIEDNEPIFAQVINSSEGSAANISAEHAPITELAGIAKRLLLLGIEVDVQSAMFHEVLVYGPSQLRLSNSAMAANGQPIRFSVVQVSAELLAKGQHSL